MSKVKAFAEQYLPREWGMSPVVFPIMGSHVKRLGGLRVFVGAIGMYLTIPVFLLIHAAVVAFVLKRVVCPLLGIKPKDPRCYIIMDRYRVEGLAAIDKFNCLFCGWANGLCTLINASVDEISNNPVKLSFTKKIALWTLLVPYTVACLVLQTAANIIYNFWIASSLDLGWVHYSELIHDQKQKRDYAKIHSPLGRFYLNYQKITWMSLTSALKHIESSWCPIKHFERMEGVVYPDHHKLFFEPHQVRELREYLKENNSVLTRNI